MVIENPQKSHNLEGILLGDNNPLVLLPLQVFENKTNLSYRNRLSFRSNAITLMIRISSITRKQHTPIIQAQETKKGYTRIRKRRVICQYQKESKASRTH